MSDGYSMLQPTEASHLRNRQTYILCWASNFYPSFTMCCPSVWGALGKAAHSQPQPGHCFRPWPRRPHLSARVSASDCDLPWWQRLSFTGPRRWNQGRLRRRNRGNRKHCGWTSHVMDSWRSLSTFYRDLLSNQYLSSTNMWGMNTSLSGGMYQSLFLGVEET